MARIKRIMFPTDFSDGSRAAIPSVERIAAMSGAEVLLVNVLPEMEIEPDPYSHYRIPEYQRDLYADTRKRLHELAGCFSKDLTILRALFFGNVIEQILKGAKHYGVDMIIMVTRGERGWRNLFFGSVAEQVLKLAECPVLSVRKPNSARRMAPSGDPPTAA